MPNAETTEAQPVSKIIKVDWYDISTSIEDDNDISWIWQEKFNCSTVLDSSINVDHHGQLFAQILIEPLEIDEETILEVTYPIKNGEKSEEILTGDRIHINKNYGKYEIFIFRLNGYSIDRKHLEVNSCPRCGQITVSIEDELTRCINISCPAILPNTIRHWWAWKGAGISDLSDEHVDLLVGSGEIQSVADLYNINCTKFQEILSVEESFAHRLVEALEESKTKSLPEIIYGLKIRYVGLATARKLAQHFLTLEELAESDLVEIENIEEIPCQAAKFIYRWFHNPANQELLKQLKAAGLQPSISPVKSNDQGWQKPLDLLEGKLQELENWVKGVIAELQKLISSNREELAKIGQDNKKSQATVLSKLEYISNLLINPSGSHVIADFTERISTDYQQMQSQIDKIYTLLRTSQRDLQVPTALTVIGENQKLFHSELSTQVSDVHLLLLNALKPESGSTDSQEIYNLLNKSSTQFDQFASTQNQFVLCLQPQLEKAQSEKEDLLAGVANLQGIYAALQLEHSKCEVKLHSVERENQQIALQLEQNGLEKAQLFSLLEQITKDNSQRIAALEQITAHRDALQQELLNCQPETTDSKRWRLLLIAASRKQKVSKV